MLDDVEDGGPFDYPRNDGGGFDGDNPEEWFFTSDHYDSFCEFAPVP